MNEKSLDAMLRKMQGLTPDGSLPVPRMGVWPEGVHVFDQRSIDAVTAAVAARRPLLVRGEPGCGKSQLARAVAVHLGLAFVSTIIDFHTEPSDLHWRFDTVARLAEAQACGSESDPQRRAELLEPGRYLAPGPLWWAFDWASAAERKDVCDKGLAGPTPYAPKGWGADQGCVLLIDELDKAEADLPNGLLGSLGNGSFAVPHLRERARIGLNPEAGFPLVIITTNEERELPPAFVRRCLVLQLGLPDKMDQLIELLVRRGTAHFPFGIEAKIREKAARLLWIDRQEARKKALVVPGQAEYLDLLRVLKKLAENDAERQEALLARLADFNYKKSRLV